MNAPEHGSRKQGRGMGHLTAAAIAVALVTAGSQLAAPRARADSPAAPILETAATVKRLGFGLSQITLPAKAAKRLDIQTGEIRNDPSGMKVAPFSSIIYDLDGDAWVYKVSAPLTYVREAIVIEKIKLDYVYLKEGPPTGTQVVTVGVPELYGAEVGVNGEYD
jgi:hypothetical protein